MDNQTELEKTKIVLLKVLQNNPIAYHVEFAKIGGGVTAGLFLSQLFFWSGKGQDKESGWIYKTQSEWTDETGLTRYEQETARKKLRKKGLIDEKLQDTPARLYYRPNLNVLIDLLSRNPDEHCNNQVCGKPTNKDVGKPHTSKGKTNKLEKPISSVQSQSSSDVSSNGTKLAFSETTTETTTNTTSIPNKGSKMSENLSESKLSDTPNGNTMTTFGKDSDESKLQYVQAIVDFFNGLQGRYRDKINAKIGRPKKITTVAKYQKGKYRTILKWYNEDIPADHICDLLLQWIPTLNTSIGGSLNYFEKKVINYLSPDQKSELEQYKKELMEDYDEREYRAN